MAVKTENSIFGYIKGNSPLHKTRAAIKLVFAAVLGIIAFWGGNPDTIDTIISPKIIVPLSTSFFFSLVLWILSGAKWSSIKNKRFVIFIGILILLFRFFSFSATENEIGETVTKFIFPDYNGIAYAFLFTLRFFISTLGAQCVFQTTSPLQIQECFEKIPFGLTLSLAINFIPEIFSTWNKISLAARSRSPRKKSIRTSVRIFYAEFSSLFSCMLNQAENKRRAVINRSI